MIDLFATPKTVGLVTGVSTALAVEAAQVVQGASVITEWTVLAGVVGGAVAWGISWGTMRTRLAAQEAARMELKADADKVAARLEVDNAKVASKVEEVAKQVDAHTDKLRAEIRETAKEHQGMMNTILREVGALSATLDTSARDTRQLIADHVASCPAARARKR